MTTTTINPGTKNGSNSAAKASMAGAAAAAAIVAGGAAYTVLNDDENTDDVLTADAGNAAETTEETAQATEETVQAAEETAQATEQPQPTAQANTNEHVDGPAPITEDIVTPEPVTPEPVTPEPVTPEPVSPENVTQNTTTSDVVDPNEIAQNIIAGEEIDPNDIDDADILDIASVGTVYGTDGEEYNAAIIEDPTGEQMMMVDVNNDGTYDVVADVEGNLIGEMPAGANITTSDAELDVNPAPAYLAQNDSDISSMAVDDIANDILTV